MSHIVLLGFTKTISSQVPLEKIIYNPKFNHFNIFSKKCNQTIELASKFIWDPRVIYPQSLGPLKSLGNVAFVKVPKAGTKFFHKNIFRKMGTKKTHVKIAFTREPVSRIFSAYGEIDGNYNAGPLSNDVPPKISFNKIARNNITSAMLQRFLLFIEDVFSDNFLDTDGKPSGRYWYPNHAYPMILTFMHHKDIKFVGRMEYLKKDWNIVQKQYTHLPDLPKVTKLETDRSIPVDTFLFDNLSNRNKNVKYVKRWAVEVMNRLSDNERIQNLLCCKYLPDFVCFGYNLPLEKCKCQHFEILMSEQSLRIP